MKRLEIYTTTGGTIESKYEKPIEQALAVFLGLPKS
jgi:hypothetical protein